MYYRYKNDVYNRIWTPDELSSDWRGLSTSANNINLSFPNPYKPPAIVMSTDVTPVNESAPLQFHWDGDNVNDQYYFMYYYEVEGLAANETRKFNITVNDKFRYGPIRPPDTLFSQTSLSGAKTHRISISKADNSTHPPILNAIEIYRLKDFFSQSKTNQDDGHPSMAQRHHLKIQITNNNWS
jgi:hypothetical protein